MFTSAIYLDINAIHIAVVSVVLTYECFTQLCLFLLFCLRNNEGKHENDVVLSGQVWSPW